MAEGGGGRGHPQKFVIIMLFRNVFCKVGIC